MGNHKAITGFFFIMVLAVLSCRDSSNTVDKETTVTDTANKTDTIPPPILDTASAIKTGNGTHCFAYTLNRDSVLMTLLLAKNEASGKLIYNFYEKDKNTGTFTGTLHNDTLLADYTFFSEGMRSERQVIFLLKGNVLVEGSGSLKEHNGKQVFSNKSDIVFNGNIILEPVNCDNLSLK